MINGKIIAIDARMIEMSGIGTYIQHIIGQGIYDYALGNEHTIKKYDADVKVIPFDAGIYSIKEQLAFPFKEVKKAKIDIVHFPHYSTPVLYKGKFVVTVHDLTHIVLPEFLGSKIKYLYAKFLIRHALNKSEHIFTVSENSKKDIINIFGINSEKITVTYNGTDKDFRSKPPKDIDYLYEKYAIPRDRFLILYVGNLKPHKNLITLLRALKQLDTSYSLILAGKAFKSVDLETQEADLGIRESVIHTGLVSKDELIDLYNLANVFVFPSLYEGFGIPPIEAMACGTPVIAANNSSIPEVVGDAAILFDGREPAQLAEEIIRIRQDQELQDELIKKGYERIRKFSWDKTIDLTKDILFSDTFD